VYTDVYGDRADPGDAYTSRTRQIHVVYRRDDDAFNASGRQETPSNPMDAETARILARYRAGATIHELASEIAGTSNPNARAYRDARAQVEATIRAALGGQVGS
jgi:hypothetical protein